MLAKDSITPKSTQKRLRMVLRIAPVDAIGGGVA
jgi:hypothetical protein